MKIFSILFSVAILFHFKESNFKSFEKFNGDILVKPKDNILWIESFKEFRTAIYKNDQSKAKTFFEFPILNADDEIWYLTVDDDKKGEISIADRLKPFTEKDFEKYFNKLFPASFVNSILKIKTDELYKKSKTVTTELKEGENITYKMYVDFNKKDKTLSLNLAYNNKERKSNGEILDAEEYNVIYFFDVLQNGQIKFKKIRLAG